MTKNYESPFLHERLEGPLDELESDEEFEDEGSHSELEDELSDAEELEDESSDLEFEDEGSHDADDGIELGELESGAAPAELVRDVARAHRLLGRLLQRLSGGAGAPRTRSSGVRELGEAGGDIEYDELEDDGIELGESSDFESAAYELEDRRNVYGRYLPRAANPSAVTNELEQYESPFMNEAVYPPGFKLVPILIPIEPVGGGRIKNKRDPAPADLVKVKTTLRKSTLPLHWAAAQALVAMQVAARQEAGLGRDILELTSGYRSTAEQTKLFARAVKKYGSEKAARKWCAKPGGSAHHSGRAVDLYLGVKGGSGNVANQRKTAAHRWLVKNAVRFGFYPYDAEPWHWEYNPPANGAPVPSRPATTAASSSSASTSSASVASDAPRLVYRTESVGPGTTCYVNIELGSTGNKDLTGIFVPRGFRPSSTVDLIVLLHGHRETSVAKYWVDKHTPPLPLREHLYNSGKNTVLVVPTLGPRSEAGTLTQKGGFDRFVLQVLRALGAHVLDGAKVALGQLVLAAHSGGGKPMRVIASGSDVTVQAALKECWAFDALYGLGEEKQWRTWAANNPARRLISHASTDLSKDGVKRGPLTLTAKLQVNRPSNVVLTVGKESHYGALSGKLQERIAQAAYLSAR